MDFCKNYSLPDWTSGFEQRKTSISQLPYEEYTGPMEKSASDANNYRLIRLPNNLVVMCVQDAETEGAAAVLSVDVGSNMDPVELQGLAHFLEHMLFMKDCVDRELCAVDSEFKGLLNNDFWRFYQLSCNLSNTEHPFSKFMIGNIETLKQSAKDNGLDLHVELLNFHNKYYSSDIMKLVVCGNHSLDQLVEWAALKFSGIKSKGDNVQRIVDYPVSAENLGKAVYFETVNDKHMINIAFPVPNTKAMYRHDPFKYIAHLIGHEGQGSILAYLKKQGWVTGLGVWSTVSQNNGFSDFTISINATPEGQGCYADILRAIFAYVKMLVTSGPQEWIQKEMSLMKRIEFDNAARVDALDWVLNYLHLIHNEYVAPEHVLSKDNAYETSNYDDVLHCLSFINPNNFRVFLGATKHSSIDCSEVEPYFGTKYHVDSISSDLLLELAGDAINVDGLCLPEKNLFIPSDFTIKNANMLGAEAVLRPMLLKLNDNFELWFKQDDQFNTPKGCISLSIKTPTVNSSPRNHLMSSLFCAMLSSKMLESLHNATNAGLEFSIFSTSSTIEVSVSGFSNKLPTLLATVLDSTKAFKVDDTQCSIYVAKYKQYYANVANSTPSLLSDIYRRYVDDASEWHHQLLEAELAKITPSKLQEHVDSLFDVTFTKMMMVGNFDEEEALRMADKVQSIVKPTPNLGYMLDKPSVYNFEPGYYLHQVQVPNAACLNSAVLSRISCGLASNSRDAVLLEVLKKFVHDSFFAQIRTKHQLGYSVHASTKVSPVGRSELLLQVEGESNPMYVTLHINKFIDDMQQRLIDMTDEAFSNRVQSLIKQYQERVKNIDIEAGKYLIEVKDGTYDFTYRDEKVKLLQMVAKEELLEFWNKYINPSTALAYTRIDVQMWSAKIWKPTVSDVKTYSAKTLALYGCLKSEGNDGLDISKINEFICKTIAARKEQVNDSDSVDTLVEQLKSAGLSESGAAYMVGESAERAKHTSTALELAITDHVTFGNYSEVSRTNFATIGMSKTPDGMWLMEDYRKFQATQQLHGLGVPAEVLVPKYSS
ncbi:metalloprotease [Coemansia sp. RSA 2681]|nr:metalloprotease [Coemansia sp. RSA 2681]